MNKQTGRSVRRSDQARTGRRRTTAQRSAIALTATAVLTAAATVATGPTLASNPTKTMTFTSVETSQHRFGKQRSVLVDKDVVNGKIVGYDTLILTGNRADVTFALPHGFLYGHLTLGSRGATGKITGGTGSFKGDRGTIKAPATEGDLVVTITYHH